MRYRDSIQKQLEIVEDKLRVLEFLIKRQEPVGKFLNTLKEAKESLNEAQSYVDREPASYNERSGLM